MAQGIRSLEALDRDQFSDSENPNGSSLSTVAQIPKQSMFPLGLYRHYLHYKYVVGKNIFSHALIDKKINVNKILIKTLGSGIFLLNCLYIL